MCTTFEYTGHAPLTNIFWEYPFLSRLYNFLPVNKILRKLGRIRFVSKSSSIYTKIGLSHKHQIIWRIWRKVSSSTFIANTFLLKLSLLFQHLIYPAQFVSKTADIIISIRSLKFSSNVYRLVWHCCFWPPLCPMMHIRSTLVVNWFQDGINIASCWSWHCNLMATACRLVSD